MKYIPYLLIAVLSIFLCVQHSEIKTLNSKVNALDYKTDNIKTEIFPTVSHDYKETFYLNQLGNSTTLVLSVIGFALVFAGIFSFKVIDDKVKIVKSSLNEELQPFKNTVNNFNGTII